MAEVKTGLEGVLKYRLIVGTATVAAGSTLSYVRGFDYSWDQAANPIYNRATFAHYKSGRGKGKATCKLDYVNKDDVDAFRTAQTGTVSFPQAYVELHVDGIAGTGEDAVQFANCALDSFSFSQPDEAEDNLELSFIYSTEPTEATYANRLIT